MNWVSLVFSLKNEPFLWLNLYSGILKTSVDPDEMPQNVAFHQSLLIAKKKFSRDVIWKF